MNLDKREFYSAVASILGVTDTFKAPRRYRRRWGQRTPGNGRFEGRGIVRWFSPTLIHVALTSPSVNGTFTSPDSALDGIRNAKFVTVPDNV